MSKTVIKQADEVQCQQCNWWRKKNGNTCLPRAYSYVISPVDKTAMPAHKKTFTIKCPFREVEGG